MGFNVWYYNVIIIPSFRPVSFATTRGMFPDHFMRRPGARGGPCHSYRGFYLSSGPDMCRPRVPPRLNAGISEILPPNGWRWLASYRKSSFIVISPGFAPWPGIENGSDTATSCPPGPHPSPPLEYFSNLEQNILTKWRKRVESKGTGFRPLDYLYPTLIKQFFSETLFHPKTANI